MFLLLIVTGSDDLVEAVVQSRQVFHDPIVGGAIGNSLGQRFRFGIQLDQFLFDRM